MKIKEQKKENIFLREVRIPRKFTEDVLLEVFQGNIEEDKKSWMKYQNARSVRYFKLKEIKNDA